jgi:hypothetical protein
MLQRIVGIQTLDDARSCQPDDLLARIVERVGLERK